MALNLSKDFTFSPSTTISSSQVNTDLDELYNAFTGLEAGTSSMSKLPLDADPASALHAATKQYVDAYANYKRPNLTWISVTQVDVESNTGTANQTKIVFPDGNYRSVTEDTAATNKYRRFDITATAEFSSGTEDSGLRSTLSETADQWYAIYAVKSTINTANFVLVGDTIAPTQSNFATLNTRYASNGWVFLGYIRNGDGGATTTDILSFVQDGHMTFFNNTGSGQNWGAGAVTGIRKASNAAAQTLTYTYVAGLVSGSIPNTIGLCYWWTGRSNPGAGRNYSVLDSAAAFRYFEIDAFADRISHSFWGTASKGVNVLSATTNVGLDIFMCGYVDGALGVGSNPLI